jgi:hypothetical protein
MTTHEVHKTDRLQSKGLPHTEDPELEALSRDKFNWPLAIGFAVVVVAAIGFLAYYSRLTHRQDSVADKPQVPVEEVAPLTAFPATPLEKALKWQADNFAGTIFETLPVQPLDGRFFIVYSAASGDSIGGIVRRYVSSAGRMPADGALILRLAVEQHAAEYHRGLWPGDEVLLLIEPLSGWRLANLVANPVGAQRRNDE